MRRLGLFLLAAPLAAMALLAPGAWAAVNHPFLHATTNLGLEDACGVARQGGGLYVSDYYDDKILTPGGQIAPESAGSGPCKLELDAAGDLYVNDWHEKVVKYPSSELLPGHATVIDSANPTGLAVEQATGDLYVAHRTYIAKYSPVGTLLEEIGGSGELLEAYGVAVSEYPATLGDIYVPDAATNTVKVFDPTGALIEELNGANTPQGHFTYFKDGEIVIDNSPTSPSYGHLYVLDAIGHGLSQPASAAIDEFNAEADYRGQVTGFTDAEPSGIALDQVSHNLFVTSGNSENSAIFEYGPSSPARTLEITKEGAGGGTVSSSPVGITCGLACAAEFNEGQTVTLFANPDAHSAFAGWSVTGSQPCPGTGSCTVSMAGNVEVKASFAEPTQETLTVSASGEGSVTSSPEGISCPGSCAEHFAQGRVVTLKATPEAHRRLASWSGCTVQANPLECKVTMSEEKAVTATFEPIPQLGLSVGLGGTGQGTVTSYPGGISCPGACSSAFDEGSTVYLMAAPAPGTGFAGFAGAGCSGTATLCAVPMGSAQSVTATFAGAASGPGTSPHASFTVTWARAVGSAAVLLTINTEEAGTLLSAGGGTKPQKRDLSAGTSRVRVKLGPHALRHLALRHRLQLRLAVGFLPSGGGTPSSRTLALGFHAAPTKAGHAHR